MDFLRVLHLEDDPLDAELIRMRLEQDGLKCEVKLVDNHQAFSRALAELQFDLILADSAIPGFGGGDGASLTLAREQGVHCPFIFVSGTIGEEKAVEFLKRGATDYVLKDRLNRLTPTVRRALEEHQERHRRQLAEERSNLLLSLINQSNDAFFVLEPETGRLLHANDQVCHCTGYTAEELVKLRFGEICGLAQPAWPEHLNRLRVSGSLVMESMVSRRDGVRFPVEINAKYVRHERQDYLVAVVRDVTERKRLEEQLRQAQKMEAIGQLAGGVAHDFNNILTIIKGYTQLMLSSGELSLSHAEDLQQVSVAAERAANLTRQLLTFSRKQVMRFHVLDLNTIVSDLAKMLQRIIGEDVKLQVELAAGLPLLEADTGMMEQVLMNLAVNARDAMSAGGKLRIATRARRFTASAAAPDRVGEFVCLEVADTGVGMPPEVQARIFEPFFTTKEPGKGTGLGLATVYGIVKQHRGWIDLESKVGKGTVFTIGFPVVPAHAAKVVTVAAPKKAARGGTETILLVEDEPALRQLTRTVLTHWGYKTLEAGSGMAALNLWHDHAAEVDLLLTDLVLPDGMNGRELARRLQLQKPGLKIIYTSGYSVDIAGQDLELREGENFLQKPYPTTMLVQIVRESLDKPPSITGQIGV